MKVQKIPDDITVDEIKELLFNELEYCSEHGMLRVRETTYNERSEKSCTLVYCPKCREQRGLVEMEFSPGPVPVERIEINFVVTASGVVLPKEDEDW